MINIIFVLETSINIIYMPYKPHKTSLEKFSKNHVCLTVRHSTIPLRDLGKILRSQTLKSSIFAKKSTFWANSNVNKCRIIQFKRWFWPFWKRVPLHTVSRFWSQKCGIGLFFWVQIHMTDIFPYMDRWINFENQPGRVANEFFSGP